MKSKFTSSSLKLCYSNEISINICRAGQVRSEILEYDHRKRACHTGKHDDGLHARDLQIGTSCGTTSGVCEDVLTLRGYADSLASNVLPNITVAMNVYMFAKTGWQLSALFLSATKGNFARNRWHSGVFYYE
jgi:hypothetical protein